MAYRPDSLLRAILIGFLLLAAALSVIIPLGEAADEVSHHSYVRYVAEFGALPPVVEGTTVFGETFQPPLYYALVAPLTAWLPTGPASNLGFDIPVENNPDWEPENRERSRLMLQPAQARWPWQGEALAWHLVRFVSVLIGAGTVYFTYRLGQVVWPEEPFTALLGAFFVACLPSFLGVSAAVTNDSLATFLAALMLWQLARLAATKAGEDGRQWVLAGLIGALGVWTKASGWLFVVTTLVAVALRVWPVPGPVPPRSFGRHLAFAGAAVAAWLAGALPLWWLNLQRSGDILGRRLQTVVTDARAGLSAGDLADVLASLVRTWWAGFGGAVHLSFSSVFNVGLLVVVAGVAVWGLARRHLSRAQAPEATRRLLPLLAFHTMMLLAAWLLWTSQVLGTGQGRLLFPALSAIALLVAGGWTGIPVVKDPRAPSSRGTLAALMVVVALQAVTGVVWPAYRSDNSYEPQPADATQGRWQVGDSALALTSFYAPFSVDSRLRPGEVSTVYLGWESGAALPDLRVRLRWIDREGAIVGAPKEGSPIADHPLTDEWGAGLFAATHRIQVPEGIASGYYRLMLSVVDGRNGAALPLRGGDGSDGEEIMVGQTTVAAP